MDKKLNLFWTPSLARSSYGVYRRAILLLSIVVGLLWTAPTVSAAAVSGFDGDIGSLLRHERWDEAVIALRTVLKRNPRSAGAAVALSRALLQVGRREEAVSVLDQTADRLRGPARANLNRRARVLSRLFLTQASFQAYQDGVNLLDGKKIRSAQEKFETVLESVERDNVELLLRVGQCQILEGDPDSAVERLRLARKLNPGDPEIRLWLGRALQQRGELPEARQELREAVRALPESETAALWFAEAQVASGDREAALQWLENDLNSHPLHVRALLSLARLRLDVPLVPEVGLKPEALMQVRKLLQLAQSRTAQYLSADQPKFESELGIDLRPEESTLKDEIRKLMDTVEALSPA